MVDQEKIRLFARDPFAGYPPGRLYSDEIKPGSLLDIEPARQWFTRIDEGRAANLYTFGLPLDRPANAQSGFGGSDLLIFSTYGYLGLNQHPRIVEAALQATERWGTTTGGVRLLTGTIELHIDTEQELADYIGAEATALFSSGYDANLAAISSLIGRDDIALVDAKAHRSILDGCRLAGCRLVKFAHNDMNELESLLHQHCGGSARVLVAVDGVYSMDGDLAKLRDVVDLKDRYGAFLLLDESHAIGVMGEHGRGTSIAAGVDPDAVDVITGSLGKAFPSGGGFVGGARSLIGYLQHGSAPYMFSSALTPANTAAIQETIRVVLDEPEHLERTRHNAARLAATVQEMGLPSGPTQSPIVPVLLGDTARAYAWARSLLDDGIYVSAVPFPAVPEGQSRLRLCATAQHRPDDFDRLVRALRRVTDWEASLADGRSTTATTRGR
jgi:8-amino-7-oxononanoate synthase